MPDAPTATPTTLTIREAFHAAAVDWILNGPPGWFWAGQVTLYYLINTQLAAAGVKPWVTLWPLAEPYYFKFFQFTFIPWLSWKTVKYIVTVVQGYIAVRAAEDRGVAP